MTETVVETEVLIAGGGPVGLAMAVELAHFGIETLLVERNPTTTSHPKMDYTNGRTMELFRRTGLAEKVRAAGVPSDSNYDAIWITELKPGGHILHKFGYDNADHEYWRRRTVNDGTLTLEAPLRVSQIVIEPVLRTAAESTGMSDVRFGWALIDFEQDAGGVTSRISNVATGETVTVRSKYLVGCDGGKSTVRRKLGIESQGDEGVGRAYLVHFRSTDMAVLQHYGQAWHYQSVTAAMIAQNDVDEWTVHTFLAPDQSGDDINPRQLIEDTFGRPFDFEVLVANAWQANSMVANEYFHGRVYMAGDACHQYPPSGGYGMNTGIAEVGNLSWKLAATIHGFGGPALLQSYHDERQPVAVLSQQSAMRNLAIRFQIAMHSGRFPELRSDTAEGAAQRARYGRIIADLQNHENESGGTEHGYNYAASKVIVDDGSPPAPFDDVVYIPNTRPGSRLPHMFLEDGSAVYDNLGKWFTLVVTDGSDGSAFATAAEKLGVPLHILAIDEENARKLYEASLLLVRPDHHIAWRGAAVPSDPEAILRTAVGLNS